MFRGVRVKMANKNHESQGSEEAPTQFTSVADALRAYKAEGPLEDLYLRFDPKQYKSGDKLPPSRKWIEGEPTEYTYEGTSVLNPRAIYVNPEVLGSYEGKVYLVRGEQIREGFDEGEVLLRDAEIVKQIDLDKSITSHHGDPTDVEADVICAWCGEKIGTKMIAPGSTPPGKKPVTHGMCEKCFKRVVKGEEPGQGEMEMGEFKCSCIDTLGKLILSVEALDSKGTPESEETMAQAVLGAMATGCFQPLPRYGDLKGAAERVVQGTGASEPSSFWVDAVFDSLLDEMKGPSSVDVLSCVAEAPTRRCLCFD